MHSHNSSYKKHLPPIYEIDLTKLIKIREAEKHPLLQPDEQT